MDRLHRDWNIDIGWGDALPNQEGVSSTTANKAQSNLLAHSKTDTRVEKRLYVRGGTKPITKWNFNGADMDQGLLCQYFILKHGNGVLIDTMLNTAAIYETGYLSEDGDSSEESSSNSGSSGISGGGTIVYEATASSYPTVVKTNEFLLGCNGASPVSKFIHFTGKSKPWMNIPAVDDVKLYMKPSSNGNSGNSNSGNSGSGNEIVLNDGVRNNANKPIINRNMLVWLQMLDSLHLNGVNSLTIGSLGLSSPLGFFNANFPKGGFKSN